MIRKFLVPVDLQFPEPALMAVRLARLFRAELLFFHCLPATARFPVSPPPRSAGWVAADGPTPEERRRLDGRIADFAAALPLAGIRNRWLVAKGDALREILAAAATHHPDWIIQGSRRPSAFREWIPGGTSWWTIQKAPCPVITVPHRSVSAAAPAAPVGGRERDAEGCILLLCGTGAVSAAALPAAAALAARGGALLVILHAAGRDAAARLPRTPGEARPQVRLRRLAEEARMLQPEVGVLPLFVDGPPEEAVSAQIRERAPAMVVMGVSGAAVAGMIPVAGFRERIFPQTRCPIMTVRPAAGALAVRPRKPPRRIGRASLIRAAAEHPGEVGEDLFGPRRRTGASGLFLNHYSAVALGRLFAAEGIFDLLGERGFAEPRLSLVLDDPNRHRLRVSFGDGEDDAHTLIEAILREGVLEAPCPPEDGRRGNRHAVLVVEWLLLQNPTADFSLARPPLPEQSHPGLGISREILELISRIAQQIGKDGVAIHPRSFHAAVIYHRLCRCFNPVQEGQLAALIRDTEGVNLGDVSWAVALDCVEGGLARQRTPWQIDDQVRPLGESLGSHFVSEEYRSRFWESLAAHRYRIDWERLETRLRRRAAPGSGPR